MKTLTEKEIIDLCSKMVHTTAEEVKQDKYKKTCFVHYIKELVLKYKLEGGFQEGGVACLNTFEMNFCKPLIGNYVWSMQGIAYIILAKYGEHSLGSINGVNILDLLFIPQEDENGNLLYKDGKIITVNNPLYAWFLEPEGFNIWINWVYYMFNPVKRPSSLSSPNALLSQIEIKKRKLTNQDLNANQPQDISKEKISEENKSSNSKQTSWFLEGIYNSPSSVKNNS